MYQENCGDLTPFNILKAKDSPGPAPKNKTPFRISLSSNLSRA